jgi:hypothetical protein
MLEAQADDQESVDRMTGDRLTDAELDELRRLSERITPPPWRAIIEGRDRTSGDSFIMTGREDDRDEDMYISRDSGLAGPAYLDFIAAARNYLPRLLDEVAELRSANEGS